jgi:hypothetical protein
MDVGATTLFGRGSAAGATKRVKSANFLGAIIIKILNLKGLKIKKSARVPIAHVRC